MPSLKDIICSIELPQPKRTLREFGTAYSDGVVETFVAVPSESSKFAIRLTSSTYIADGLAMFVYIDGVYQCNRNRLDMKERVGKGKPVELVVRQKEEKQKDGRIIARDWAFGKLNVVAADQAPQQCSPNVLDNIGCIEVIVLRCKGVRIPKNGEFTMGFDGGYDSPDDYFDVDGRPQSWAFDDRSVFPTHEINRVQTRAHVFKGNGQPLSASRSLPPLSRRSYSPSAAPRVGGHISIPEGAFQYGSGPVPRQSRAESDAGLFADRAPRNITGHDIVNPEWLKQIKEEAYQRGLREAELKRRRGESERHIHGAKQSSESVLNAHSPGAWPPPLYEHGKVPPVNTDPGHSGSLQAGAPRNPWGPTDGGSWEKAHQGWPENEGTSGWHWPKPEGNESDSWATSGWETDSISAEAVDNGFRKQPVASTAYRGDASHRRSSLGRAPTVQTVAESAPRPNGPDDSWDTATSVWSTASTIISPREHMSRGQASRPQRKMTSPSDSWTSPPSQIPVKPPSKAATIRQPSRRDKNPSPQLPPVPVPLNFYGKPSGPSQSPPPPYHVLPVHLFHTCSKASVVNSELPSGTQTSNKSAWPWATLATNGTHADDTSVSKQKKPPSRASSVWSTNDVSADNKADHSKGWDTCSVRMPGSWDEGDNPKTKSNKGDGWSNDWHPKGAGDTKGGDGWEQGGQESIKNASAEKSGEDSGWKDGKNGPDWEASGNNPAWDTENKDSQKQDVGFGPSWGTTGPNAGIDDTNKKADGGDGTWTNTNNNAEAPAWDQTGDADKLPKWDNDKNNQNEEAAKASEKAWNAEGNNNQNEASGDVGWDNAGWGKTPGAWPSADNIAPNQGDNTAGWDNTGNNDDAQKKDTPGDVAGGGWENNNEERNDTVQPTWENDNSAMPTQDNRPADQGWTNAADAWNIPQEKQDAASVKHSTSSARKSRLRQYRRPPSRIGAKPHWIFPPPPPSTSMHKLYPIPEDQESTAFSAPIAKGFVLPPEPLPPIPEDKAKKKGLSHQVQPGEGMRYTHAVGRPKYLDGFEKPYAVFRFKYRSREELKRLFGDEVPDEEDGFVVSGGDGGEIGKESEREKEDKERLKVMSEEEKVDEILRLKKMLEAKKVADGEKKEEGGEANDFTKEWVKDQMERSRKSSQKAASKKSASNKGGEAIWGGGWGGEAAGSKKAVSQNGDWNRNDTSKKSESKKGSQKAESKKGEETGGWGEAAWGTVNVGETTWDKDGADAGGGGGGGGGGDWKAADAGEPNGNW
ncbi:uncharacterized protein EI97DRAFT_248285 [Westerdykella ornata]|uniref:DUF7918 domain-containing protein n=1 Tax=Westerdykella ornata TaxID=318751 RepID=A0A6A6JQ07_WESOR|nr:uncharacterized protein EI97DRAFT_248285 [Westerdykella ornata]KAF2278213.1 hypothetical protein EI97DRAFT_248285 [Westerdykella ornata]